MALVFDMSRPSWQEQYLQQQQRAESGRNVGQALGGAADYLRKNKGKLGRAYQAHLMTPNLKAGDIDFDKFVGQFRAEKKTNRIFKKFPDLDRVYGNYRSNQIKAGVSSASIPNKTQWLVSRGHTLVSKLRKEKRQEFLQKAGKGGLLGLGAAAMVASPAVRIGAGIYAGIKHKDDIKKFGTDIMGLAGEIKEEAGKVPGKLIEGSEWASDWVPGAIDAFKGGLQKRKEVAGGPQWDLETEGESEEKVAGPLQNWWKSMQEPWRKKGPLPPEEVSEYYGGEAEGPLMSKYDPQLAKNIKTYDADLSFDQSGGYRASQFDTSEHTPDNQFRRQQLIKQIEQRKKGGMPYNILQMQLDRMTPTGAPTPGRQIPGYQSPLINPNLMGYQGQGQYQYPYPEGAVPNKSGTFNYENTPKINDINSEGIGIPMNPDYKPFSMTGGY